MKKIVLTGGGTAGHVTPNLALVPALAKKNFTIVYIGSKNGPERELTQNSTKLKYYGISSGKLRRYLDLKNFTDVFRVVKGLGEAYKILKDEKPDIVFSKGGFVIVPVVIAAKLRGIPVIIHESDMSPGLANRISLPLASAVCVSFPETLDKLPKNKTVLTGTPIRRELSKGDKEKGLKLCGFDNSKPVVMFMGGSTGSAKINSCLRQCLPKLLKSLSVIHLCGRGNVDPSVNYEGYSQFEYVTHELPHLLEASDIVVSRAGANAIFELLSLKKPNLLIPLSRAASRGDQIENAKSFAALGFSEVLWEEEMNETTLLTGIIDLYSRRESYINKMKESELNDGIDGVIKVIEEHLKEKK